MNTYRVERIAMLLSVNPETVRRWCQKGELKGVRGSSRRDGYDISESDFVDFLRRHPKYKARLPIIESQEIVELRAKLEVYEKQRDLLDVEIEKIKRTIECLLGEES